MATLPKSNSAYVAIEEVTRGLEKMNAGDVPNHLKDTHYSAACKLGIGGYLYPHNYPNSYVPQNYMPDNMKNNKYRYFYVYYK